MRAFLKNALVPPTPILLSLSGKIKERVFNLFPREDFQVERR